MKTMLGKKIIIVSGLPRSGTSMMMAMLEAAGIPTLTDNLRKADQDNPKGYWELQKVKQIQKDQSWLPQAQGKAVKMISALLEFLPPNYHYQVVFMEREMKEILLSQQKMITRRKEQNSISDKKMKDLFENHLKEIKTWLKKQSNFEVLYLSYNQTLKNPDKTIQALKRFLKKDLNLAKMSKVVDPKLHRNQK